MARSLLTIGICIATTIPAGANDEVVNVELEPISRSPCDDAIAQLDPNHEIQPALTCKKVEQLRLGSTATIEIDRVVGMNASLGYALVLSVHQRPDDTVWKLFRYASECHTGTCNDYTLRSAHLLQLDPKGDPSFGLELETADHVSHTFKDMGSGGEFPMHDRLACAFRARVLDCKQITLGGDCRVLGWNGTAVRYACTNEAQLVPMRGDDADGIPQADVERVSQLYSQIDRTIAENQRDCGDLVKQLDKLVDRERDAVSLARALNTPSGTLRQRFTMELRSSLTRLSGAHTCLEQKPVQDALARLTTALGF